MRLGSKSDSPSGSDAPPAMPSGMEVAFRTKTLRDLCENEELMAKRFGPEITMALMRRLADLRASTSLSDLVLGDPRDVPGTNSRFKTIEIAFGHRLVIRANHAKNPTLSDGKTDWRRVSHVQVMSIEVPHA